MAEVSNFPGMTPGVVIFPPMGGGASGGGGAGRGPLVVVPGQGPISTQTQTGPGGIVVTAGGGYNPPMGPGVQAPSPGGPKPAAAATVPAGQSAQIYGGTTAEGQPLTAQQLQMQAQQTLAYAGAAGPGYYAGPGGAGMVQNYITVKLPGGREFVMPVSPGFAEKYKEYSREYERAQLPRGPPTGPAARALGIPETATEEATRLYPSLNISAKLYFGLLTLGGPQSAEFIASQLRTGTEKTDLKSLITEGALVQFRPSETAAKPYLVSTIVREAGTQLQPGESFGRYAELVGGRYAGFAQSIPGQLLQAYAGGMALRGAYGAATALKFGGAFETVVISGLTTELVSSTKAMLGSDIPRTLKAVNLATTAGQLYMGAKGFGEGLPIGIGKVEAAEISGRTIETPRGIVERTVPIYYGVYLRTGIEARPLIGVTGYREIVIGKPGIPLPEGYVPVMDTSLAREVGIASMKATGAGTAAKGMELIITKGAYLQPSKFVSPDFSMLTQRFTLAESEALKRYIMKQPEAYLFYGSAGEQAQLKPELRFLGRDIDFKAMLSYEKTRAAAEDMAASLSKASGGKFRAPALEGEKPIVEKMVEGQWVKVIEISPKEPLPGDVEALGETIGEGFKAQAPIKIGGLKMLRLGEQLTRRYVAIGEPKYSLEEGYSFGPMERRAKDIPVFGVEAETLIASRETSLSRINPLYASKTAYLRRIFESLKAVKPEMAMAPEKILLAKMPSARTAFSAGEYFKNIAYGLSGGRVSYTSADVLSRSPSPSISRSVSLSIPESPSPVISKSPYVSPPSPSPRVYTSTSISPPTSPSISVSPPSPPSISISLSKEPPYRPPAYLNTLSRQAKQYKEKKTGPRLFRGFLKWRQGFVFRMWNPSTGESKVTRRPMQGVTYARGIRSAYRSATLHGEYIPAASRKMGIVRVGVGETYFAKPKLTFRRTVR